MRRKSGAMGARLAVLLGILVVGAAGAAYVWFNKLKDEGVISLDVDRDLVTWPSAKVPGLQVYSVGADWDKGGSSPQAGVQVRIINGSKYEIKNISIKFEVYRFDGTSPIFEQERTLGSFQDEWTGYRPTLLPGGTCIGATGMTLTSEARTALDSNGRYNVEVTKVALYDSPKDMSNAGHLYTLLANKDTDAFKKALARDPSLAQLKPLGGITPAHIAASRGLTEALELIRRDGGNLKAKMVSGETPMHLAAMCAEPVAIKYLADHGVGVNDPGFKGQAPLILACKDADAETVGELLDLGANANISDFDGLTPLHDAARHGSPDMVKLLIDAGAKIEAKSKDGATPLAWAVLGGNLETVKLLVSSGADIHTMDKDDDTLLHLAAWSYNDDLLNYCLKLGLSKRKKDKYGRTPADMAQQIGRDDWVKLLKP